MSSQGSTIYVDDADKREIKAAAAIMGKTMQEVVAMIVSGDGPNSGESLGDWARRVAEEGKAK